MPSKRKQFYDDQFSKGKSRLEAVAKDMLRIYSSNQKSLICFREQSNYDSKSAEMFQYGDTNQDVSGHVENVILLTKVNTKN